MKIKKKSSIQKQIQFLHIFFQLKIHRWLKDLFKSGLKKPLTEHEIYTNLNKNDSARLTDLFEQEWEKEKRSKKPRLLNVIWKICVSKIIAFSCIYSAIDIGLR